MYGGTIEQRVARGAAFLDARHPGWAARIDLDWLDLSMCDRCVLGQLFGDFNEAPQHARLEAYRLGFDRPPGMVGMEYTKLTAEWRRLIRERVASGVEVQQEAGA